MQHFLYFFPLPQGHGALRPTLGCVLQTGRLSFTGVGHDTLNSMRAWVPVQLFVFRNLSHRTGGVFRFVFAKGGPVAGKPVGQIVAVCPEQRMEIMTGQVLGEKINNVDHLILELFGKRAFRFDLHPQLLKIGVRRSGETGQQAVNVGWVD